MHNSTQRFSDKVENYVKFRPHYPTEIISFLKTNFGLNASHIIADIGSGTGISAELFLENGNTVFGIEPNAPMRLAAEKLFFENTKFKSIDSTAEKINLPDASVDIIVAGQAFHWFDREKTRKEFVRISKKETLSILMWNERLENTDFLKEYEKFIVKYSTDYTTINHKNVDKKEIEKFYFPAKCVLKIVPNFQEFDFEGLKGRLLSSSYIPTESSDLFVPMIAELKIIFLKHQKNGIVKIAYETKVYYGKLL